MVVLSATLVGCCFARCWFLQSGHESVLNLLFKLLCQMRAQVLETQETRRGDDLRRLRLQSSDATISCFPVGECQKATSGVALSLKRTWSVLTNFDYVHCSCESWRDSGYCTKDYVEYMRRECRKACGFCGAATTVATITTSSAAFLGQWSMPSSVKHAFVFQNPDTDDVATKLNVYDIRHKGCHKMVYRHVVPALFQEDMKSMFLTK